jgi:hypothetical protein
VPGRTTQNVTVQAESEVVQVGAAPAGAGKADSQKKMAGGFSPVPKSALDAKAKGLAAFGLRYTLFRRGADNKDAEVPPDTPFARKESARVRIEADQSGYLYVLAGKQPLFTGLIAAGQPVFVETRPGVLHLVLLPNPDSGPLSTLVTRTRQQLAGANVQMQKQADLRQVDQSVVVQNSSPPPQNGIVADIPINAQR